MKIKLINQIFEVEKSFGFTINQFDIESPFKIDRLLSTNVLEMEFSPNSIRETSKNGEDPNEFLKGLFYSQKLSEKDFKVIGEIGIIYYLEGFSDSEQEWGEDKPTFKRLLAKFVNNTVTNLNDCYLINKEWFRENSEKVRRREYDLYDFYFIIIWIDKNDDSILYISEWFSD